MRSRLLSVLIVLCISATERPAIAYDLLTHTQLSEAAFDAASRLRTYLEEIGVAKDAIFDPDRDLHDPNFSAEDSAAFAGFKNDGTAKGWLIAGTIREDDYQRNSLLEAFGCEPAKNPPSTIGRPIHHFFDVQRGGAGLVPAGGVPAPAWALGLQGRGPSGNQFSLLDARAYQLRSLTASDRSEQNRNAAKLFRALGQVTHVLQDMAQPQHTRNDAHLGCANAIAEFFGGEKSWYEIYVETRALGERYRNRSDASRSLILSGYNPVSLGSYLDYWVNASGSGLAEFSSRNFFSPGSNLGRFSVSGPCAGLSQPVCNPMAFPTEELGFTIATLSGESVTGRVTFLLGTVTDVASGELISNVRLSTRSLWDQHLEQKGQQPQFSLNTYNYDAMADLLIPRAVGYSAGFLDFFFRGRLDVDLETDDIDPSQVRITGTNLSPDPLDGGTMALYADRATADSPGGIGRVAVPPVDANLPVVADPNGTVRSGVFRLPADAERFVAVYTGKLGSEAPADNSPGAVIGKVLGGVRVEHVFADGDNWKVRTPRGVFTLPLTTAEFSDVRWGTAPDVLVARTLFGEGQPNRFASFAVQRRPASVDLVADAETGMLTIRDLVRADFPFGTPLGTTIVFNQIVHYRQRLIRVNPLTVRLRSTGVGMNYEPSNTSEAASPVVEDVRVRDFPFNDSFDVILDPPHNSQFDLFEAQRYIWDVTTVTADSDGRILAIIQVSPLAPREQKQRIEYFGLDTTTGELQEQGKTEVEPFIPLDAGGIWALLDVATGQVLASTAGPELVLSSTAHSEDPPTIWVKRFDHYEDGPNADIVAEFPWSVLGAGPFTPDRGTLRIGAEIHIAMGLETLTATGLRRDDLAEVLPISTTLYIMETTRDIQYLEVNDHQLDGLRIITTEGVVPPSAFLSDANVWSTGGALKLALLAQDTEEAGGAGHVVAWDYQAQKAAIVADLRPGLHGLRAVTASAALVTSLLQPNLDSAGFVVRLDAARPPVEFLGVDLGSFTLLDPSYLYNTADTKFYRLSPPLRKTALPAALAGASVEGGAFHALPIPYD